MKWNIYVQLLIIGTALAPTVAMAADTSAKLCSRGEYKAYFKDQKTPTVEAVIDLAGAKATGKLEPVEPFKPPQHFRLSCTTSKDLVLKKGVHVSAPLHAGIKDGDKVVVQDATGNQEVTYSANVTAWSAFSAGALLGCATNANCGAEEYCNLDMGCGENGAKGTCEKTPENCIAVSKPVTGCDGKTYSSECVAHQARVSVKAS